MKTRFRFISVILVGSAMYNPAGANGTKDNIVTPQVVNGDAVRKGKYKFVAALQREDFKSNEHPTGHICGASLLSSKYILTAAHCVSDVDENGNLVVGNTSLYSTIVGMTEYGKNQGQQRGIRAIHVHPLYDEWLGDAYDVAVLELDEKITGLPKVKLAQPGEDAPGTVPTVAGWGSIVADHDLPDYEPVPVLPAEMRAVKLPVIDDQSCSKAYSIFYKKDLQLCTYLPARGDCQGDSGGPLFRKIGGRYVQVGIVSGGAGCAAPNMPNLYTRVSSPAIQEFIKSVTSLRKSTPNLN